MRAGAQRIATAREPEMPGSRAWSRAWRSSKTGAAFACRIPTRPSGGEPRASSRPRGAARCARWPRPLPGRAGPHAREGGMADPRLVDGGPCGRGALWTGSPVDGEPCGRGGLWHHRSGTRGERTCGAHAAPGGPSRGDVTGGALRPVLLDRPPGPIDRCAPVSGPSRMSPGRERCPNPAWPTAAPSGILPAPGSREGRIRRPSHAPAGRDRDGRARWGATAAPPARRSRSPGTRSGGARCGSTTDRPFDGPTVPRTVRHPVPPHSGSSLAHRPWTVASGARTDGASAGNRTRARRPRPNAAASRRSGRSRRRRWSARLPSAGYDRGSAGAWARPRAPRDGAAARSSRRPGSR